MMKQLTLLDFMEYSSDATAQSNYVTNATDGGVESVTLSDYTDDDNNSTFNYNAYNGRAQGIKTATTDPITKFSFRLYKDTASITGTITGYIYSDDGSGHPNASLATFSNISADSLANSSRTFDFTGTFTPVVGTQYHIAIIWTGGTSGNHVLHIIDVNKAYTDGFVNYYVPNWSDSNPNQDCWFRVYQTTVKSLQSYSESTIKTQGDYSLKGIGIITGSLNKTLTRTIGSPIDLTGATQVKFDMRASRTGSNIKIGLHDSGGTTTEITPNILSANTWQEVIIPLKNIINANKDAIDSIIITIANADAANTFYIDNLFGYFISQSVMIG